MENMEITIGKIMKTTVYTVSPESNIIDAVREMKKHRVGSLVAVEGVRPVGIITGSDILYKVVAEGKDLKKTLIKDVMSAPVITIDPNKNVKEAAELMNKHLIEKLPVVEDGKLVGIVTTTDLVEHSQEFLDVMVNLVIGKQQQMGG